MLRAMLEVRDVGCAEKDEKIISFVMTRRHLGWREKAALLTSFLVLVAEQQEPRDPDFVPERDSQLSDAAIDAAMDADGELSATPPDILAQLARDRRAAAPRSAHQAASASRRSVPPIPSRPRPPPPLPPRTATACAAALP